MKEDSVAQFSSSANNTTILRSYLCLHIFLFNLKRLKSPFQSTIAHQLKPLYLYNAPDLQKTGSVGLDTDKYRLKARVWHL